MKTAVIINPNSNNGKTKQKWPYMKSRFDSFFQEYKTEFTTRPGEATVLCRQLLEAGAEHIIAVGGDGTMNEVINGFFKDGQPINSAAVFSPVMMGRGNDFEKSLISIKSPMYKNKSALERSLYMIENATDRSIDAGRVTYTSESGKEEHRYFINLASCGQSGMVDRMVNKSQMARYIGGKGAFLMASMRSLLEYQNQPVELILDGKPASRHKIRLLVVANGQYAGGGMWFAPEARLDDGLFNVIVFDDVNAVDSVMNMQALYNGSHLNNPKINQYKAAKVEVRPVSGGEVLLDIDGESPGRLPATFEVLPGAVKIRYGLD